MTQGRPDRPTARPDRKMEFPAAVFRRGIDEQIENVARQIHGVIWAIWFENKSEATVFGKFESSI